MDELARSWQGNRKKMRNATNWQFDSLSVHTITTHENNNGPLYYHELYNWHGRTARRYNTHTI